MSPWVGTIVATEGKTARNIGLWIAIKCISLGFFIELISFIGVSEEKLIRKIHQIFHTGLQVSKPKVKKNRQIEWKYFQGFFKNKNKKKYEDIEFHNSFQNQAVTTVYRL